MQAIPGAPNEIICRLYGSKGIVDTDYYTHVWIHGFEPYEGGSVKDLFNEGAVNNIRYFHPINRSCFLLLCAILSIVSGCQMFSGRVTSDPPGADVYFHDWNGTHYAGQTPLASAFENPGTVTVTWRDGTVSEKRGLGAGTLAVHFTKTPYIPDNNTLKIDTDTIDGSSSVRPLSQPAVTYVGCPLSTHGTRQVSVAVMDFDTQPNDSAAGRALADLCRQVVIDSSYYILLDRQNILTILGEEDFSKAIHCDETQCLVNYGQRLKAQKMIHGRVNKVGSTFVLTIAMTDVSRISVDSMQTIINKDLDFVTGATQSTSCELLRSALKRR